MIKLDSDNEIKILIGDEKLNLAEKCKQIYDGYQVDKDYWGDKAEEMMAALKEVAKEGYNKLVSDFRINIKEYEYLSSYFRNYGFDFILDKDEKYVLSFPIK